MSNKIDIGPHARVFISHSYNDTKWVRSLSDILTKRGVSVWSDRSISLGEPWANEVERAVQESEYVFIILDSQNAFSPNVAFELGMALGLRKKVVPIVARNFPLEMLPEPMQSFLLVEKLNPTDVAEQLLAALQGEEIHLRLEQETRVPAKQAVQSGEVQVQKIVHERQEEIPVNVRLEQVTIERHAVNQPVEAGEIGDLQDEAIRVPVYEEQAQLEKQARIKEEVVIGKEAVLEQQTLTGTTRHEQVEGDETNNVNVRRERIKREHMYKHEDTHG